MLKDILLDLVLNTMGVQDCTRNGFAGEARKYKRVCTKLYIELAKLGMDKATADSIVLPVIAQRRAQAGRAVHD